MWYLKLSNAQRKTLRHIYSNCFGRVGVKGMNISAYHKQTIAVLKRLELIEESDDGRYALTLDGKAWCEENGLRIKLSVGDISIESDAS